MSEAVHRVRIPAVEVEGYPDLWNYSPQLDPERPAVEPGVWLSEPEDEARDAVVAAARAYVRLVAAAPEMREAPDFESAYEDMLAATSELDALTKGDA